jgi:hypothetical protein
MAEANSPRENVRALQRALYVAAKRNGRRKFPVLYDRIARPDVLQRAFEQVRRNRGAAGIDGETLKAIEAQGVELDRMLGLPQNDPVTLDLDSTTEVYGGQKEDATYNYEGKRSLGSLFCTWAERRRVVAAQLRSGSASDKPISPAVVQRALRTLPQGHGEVRLRADSGFYSVPFLKWCRRHRLGFCVVVPPYQTMWEARRHISPMSWRPAQEMAERPVVPTGWEGEPLRLLVRRVRVEAEEISQSSRSRRRRTIPKQQLRLALKGVVGHTYSYFFIVTDLSGDAVELEHWQRRRAHIEEQIKDLRLGSGLLHRPLRKRRADYAWQTAVVIASNLTAMLSAANVSRERQEAQAAAGGTLSAEELAAVGQPHNTAVLRRWLLAVPARLACNARQLRLRLAHGMFHKQEFWALHRHVLNLAPAR